MLPEYESQTSREIPKREDTVRKRKIKDITKVLRHEQAQEIEPYRKKPRMSHFRFENVMLYLTNSFIQSASFDTLWTFSFNFIQDIPCEPDGIVKGIMKRHIQKKLDT